VSGCEALQGHLGVRGKQRMVSRLDLELWSSVKERGGGEGYNSVPYHLL
jgi:hypothetical protein